MNAIYSRYFTGLANMAAYSVAKSAVIKITESMAAELRDKPPDALADVIVFLASDPACAVNGAAIPVVGLS